ncbi:cytidylate kinase [Synergistales bacterium]|nr:cytidylate kinase [Synergistales bacterium]
MAFVVTIDGPAGAGKSTVAKRLAKRLGIRYLDTGAIYRALAYWMDKIGVSSEQLDEISQNLASIKIRLDKDKDDKDCVFVNGEDVTGSIRSPRIDRIVSGYAALRCVRDALLGLQREQAEYGNLIADGRDTGSVVFPNADLKFFLTASAEARAERRYKELLRKGEAVLYNEVLSRIKERDKTDSERANAPLAEPKGAIHIDTSHMEEAEVVSEFAFIIQSKLRE